MPAQANQETVLITGGTDGLGRATAVLLAEQGYRVFVTGRNPARRDALTALARERSLPIEAIEMDVCDDASVDHGVSEVERRAQPIDVLINNAGIGFVAVVEELRLDDFRRQFETNFFGVLRVTQRVLPAMRARRRGRIINMSSIAGKISIPLFGAYSGSKFALEGMSDALRFELRPFGIHVVLIEPGYIPTGFQAMAGELSSLYRQNAASPYRSIYDNYHAARKKMAEGIRDTPEDCARVVLRAVRDTPPRPRYTVTRPALLLSLAKRLLSDRAFDRLVIRRFRLEKIENA